MHYHLLSLQYRPKVVCLCPPLHFDLITGTARKGFGKLGGRNWNVRSGSVCVCSSNYSVRSNQVTSHQSSAGQLRQPGEQVSQLSGAEFA
ncbi:hypothetical protein E2C01_087141 [Portunus trituberculatus]|uniref:Uncharacterized protein n=1 Tax=Portunus trituberculatus TaxID=210409 RepID=A0A5B7JB57_PORTR|nr:hypothetical protein [Portunus trituberculatus]